ncbi:unnamed protein product, partial [Adineta steineri]
NQDNQADLAVVTYYGNTIDILLGNNDGNFRPKITFYNDTCAIPFAIAVGDFNRDSQMDIAVTDMNGYVCILLGTGDGHFNVLITIAINQFSYANAIAVGDFNNGNRLDLVITNSNKDNIGIMIGIGDGGFQQQIIFSTGYFSHPMSVIVDDFNNDGQLDLAVSNNYAHNVGVLLGIENRTFLAQMTYSTGFGSIPLSINSGDFNSDGKLDLVITDNLQNNVGILLNTCDCCMNE